MKKFRTLVFQRYKIFHSNPRNDRDMFKSKKSFLGATFFFWLGVHIFQMNKNKNNLNKS